MSQENFKASVQYNDLKGTVAADRHDRHTMMDYLEEKGLLQAGEVCIGIKMRSGEVHSLTQENDVNVIAIVATGEGYDDIKAAVDSGNPLQVRKIRFGMPLNEFFGLFKRFEVCISSKGLIDCSAIEF